MASPCSQCIFTKQSITAALGSCQREGLGNAFNENLCNYVRKHKHKALLLKVIHNQKVMTFDVCASESSFCVYVNVEIKPHECSANTLNAHILCM